MGASLREMAPARSQFDLQNFAALRDVPDKLFCLCRSECGSADFRKGIPFYRSVPTGGDMEAPVSPDSPRGRATAPRGVAATTAGRHQFRSGRK
jgi:hypothetical protein